MCGFWFLDCNILTAGHPMTVLTDWGCYGKLLDRLADWPRRKCAHNPVSNYTHCPGTLPHYWAPDGSMLITVSNFPHLSTLSLKHEEITDATPGPDYTVPGRRERKERNVRESSRLAHKSELHWYDNYYGQLVNYQTIAYQNEENCNLVPGVLNTSTRLFCCFYLMSATNRRKYE